MLKHLDYLMISNGGCDPFHYLKGRGGLGYKPSPPYMHGLGYDYNLIDGMGINGGTIKDKNNQVIVPKEYFTPKIDNAQNEESLNKIENQVKKTKSRVTIAMNNVLSPTDFQNLDDDEDDLDEVLDLIKKKT